MGNYSIKASSDGLGMIVSSNVEKENIVSEAWAALRIRCLADKKGLRVTIAYENNGWYSFEDVSGLTMFGKLVSKKVLRRRVEKAIKRIKQGN